MIVYIYKVTSPRFSLGLQFIKHPAVKNENNLVVGEGPGNFHQPREASLTLGKM